MYTIIIPEDFRNQTGCFTGIESVVGCEDIRKLKLRVVAIRSPKKGEWFLRPTGKRQTWKLEVAQNDFDYRCYEIVE